MTARHHRASHWLKKGLFDDLNSFEAFEARVNAIPEEKDRGDIFEIFIEGYLRTQAIVQCVNHWVVGSIPLPMRQRYNLPSDGTGIDGLYETHDGSHVAYQVKYRQKHQLTFAEVAPFLGITEKFADRVIFTNASALSDKALARTRWISADVFRALAADELGAIEAWLKDTAPPSLKATPDPSYQIQALQDIATTLHTNDRATVVMACGTGKTLVALWAAEQAQPTSVLVLVPSLTLLQQTLKEWSQHTNWGSRFSYLCVCSDPTVGLEDDQPVTDVTDVGFRIDTEPAVVRKFLERDTTDIKVLFSTYQSSPVVGEGARGLSPFDIGIFDEAHKTAGPKGGVFAYGLADENIAIRKRLFFTATPRHFDIRHRDTDGDFKVISMDDESVYGPRAHTLTFGRAATRGIICNYKVVISVVDSEEIDTFKLKHGITLVDQDLIGASWVASQMAVERAISASGAKHAITFHSRVSSAREFGSDTTRGVGRLLPDFSVFHVNGAQRTADRVELIRAFRDAPKALITNARCLTEGVDVPAVDMVAFVDPRHSTIDIAQATGRAMRKPRGTDKQIGYVVVPLYLNSREDEPLNAALERSDFAGVANVLNAIQEQDEELVQIIQHIQEEKGLGKAFNPRQLGQKIEVVGPSVEYTALQSAIFAQVVDEIGHSWDEWYGRLKAFKAREGHCRVHLHWVENGYKLGSWVSNQRTKKDSLPSERREKLEELGFIWHTLDSDWEDGFRKLHAFQQREGHCLVPQRGNVVDGFNLGAWVSNQRIKKETLSAERIARLDALGFVWNTIDARWEQGFLHLKEYKQIHGHCQVPQFHVANGFKLGFWVSAQRQNRSKLSSRRISRLNDLGLHWDAEESRWEEGLLHLKAFREREGHCNVPIGFIQDDFRLGGWVANQRTRKAKSRINEYQLTRLDELGFIWSPLSDAWERGYTLLKAFREREGHCRVPKRGAIVNGFDLGAWVGQQRSRSSSLSSERRSQLNELSFDWDPFATQWESSFSALKEYCLREGHCDVPAAHVEKGIKLGQWVGSQRRTKHTLSEERISKLDDVGFVWKALENRWSIGIQALEAFRSREGHSRVPADHKEGEFSLGKWVAAQRTRKDELAEDRIAILNQLDFLWDPLGNDWTEGFRHLNSFFRREGHCRVPQSHNEEGYNLGNWVARQRRKRSELSEQRSQMLEDLGFVWNTLEERWNEGFRHLKLFHEREGHCRVPFDHKEGNYKLGSWVGMQRKATKDLSEQRRGKLDELGFVWDVFEQQWELGFRHLKSFWEREGHCRVPIGHRENDFKLGVWVSAQRSANESIPGERRRKLDELGFVWDVFEQQWELGFRHLKLFFEREGHCRVPHRFSEGDFNLGSWVAEQRKPRRDISADRRRKLDDLGFDWGNS